MASTRTSNRAIPIAIWGTALILVGLAVYAIHSLSRDKVGVFTAQVAYRNLTLTSATTGKVEPVDEFPAHALVASQVEQIYVAPMQKVNAGQLLLKMDDTDALARLASANSALRAAELAVSDIEQGGTQDERNTYAADLNRETLQRKQDEAALESLKKLQQHGAAAADEVLAAQQRIAMDDVTLRGIQQHSTQRYGQADRARALAELANARAAVAAAQSGYASEDVRTPISGTVYYLPVSQYDYVHAGEDLVYVANLAHLRITAYFDEPEIGLLARGQSVTITWEAEQGKTWTGHVSLAPTTIISYGTRNVGECFIDVDDVTDHGATLKPDANVMVTVTTAQHPHVLSLPREALRYEGTQPYVFRVVDSKLVRTDVVTGIINLKEFEVVHGLAEGDTVALNATTPRELNQGLVVVPTPLDR